jgi:hypothetical protein
MTVAPQHSSGHTDTYSCIENIFVNVMNTPPLGCLEPMIMV